MKLRLETIYSLVYGSRALADLAAQKEIESVLAYKIGRALKRMKKEAAEVEEQRLALVEKYGEKVDGKGVNVKPDSLPDFTREWKTLLAEEVEVEVRALPLTEFQKGGAKLSPDAVCDLLDVLITDEGEK